MDIQLSLLEIWFTKTNHLIKLEDYRSITPYWCNRLLLHKGKSMSKNWWQLNFFENRSIEKNNNIFKSKLFI